MGDIYNIIGQAGAVGPDAQAAGNTFNQGAGDIEQSIDFAQLGDELARLRQAMIAEAKKPEHFIAIGKVAEAENALQDQDRSKAFESLKSVGKWGLDFTSKVGASLTAELIKHYLGMK